MIASHLYIAHAIVSVHAGIEPTEDVRLWCIMWVPNMHAIEVLEQTVLVCSR